MVGAVGGYGALGLIWEWKVFFEISQKQEGRSGEAMGQDGLGSVGRHTGIRRRLGMIWDWASTGKYCRYLPI